MSEPVFFKLEQVLELHERSIAAHLLIGIAEKRYTKSDLAAYLREAAAK